MELLLNNVYKISVNINYFAEFLQCTCILLSLFAYKFVSLQHNSSSTARIVMKVLGSIRTVTGKN